MGPHMSRGAILCFNEPGSQGKGLINGVHLSTIAVGLLHLSWSSTKLLNYGSLARFVRKSEIQMQNPIKVPDLKLNITLTNRWQHTLFRTLKNLIDPSPEPDVDKLSSKNWATPPALPAGVAANISSFNINLASQVAS